MTGEGNLLLSTTIANYRKVLVDNAYSDIPSFRLANESGRKRTVSGGTSLVEHLLHKKQTDGGWFAGKDPLNTTQGENAILVEYKWQNCYEPIQLTFDDEMDNNGDMEKLIDLAGTRMQQAELAIKDRMGQATVTDVAEATNLNDLSTIVNTGTLGTIAGGTDTFWQATVTTSGAFATQGLTDMQTLYQTLSSSSNMDNPTHIITTRTVYNKYEQTRLPLERLMNTSTANAGFQNLTFKGVPIIWDQYVDSGVLYMLNMNYLQLQVHSKVDFVTTEFVRPSNQMIKVAFILWRGGFTTNNRRRLGKLTSIT
jgi:hypothetical protein